MRITPRGRDAGAADTPPDARVGAIDRVRMTGEPQKPSVPAAGDASEHANVIVCPAYFDRSIAVGSQRCGVVMVRSSNGSPFPFADALMRNVTGSSSIVPTARSSQAWSGTLTVNVAVSGARAAIDSR